MSIGIFGNSNHGTPFLSTAGFLVDLPAFARPLGSKVELECAQTDAIVSVLWQAGLLRWPFSVVAVKDDPPDQILTIGARSWGIELTQLTAEASRRAMALPRLVADALDHHILGNPQQYPHLAGRLVSLAWTGKQRRRLDIRKTVDHLAELLRDDRGSMSDLPIASELPDRLPDSGRYGECGPFDVFAQANPMSTRVPKVSATALATVTVEDALAGFRRCVHDKDEEGNDILFITCGLPDARGYSCAADSHLFEFLCETMSAGTPLVIKRPENIASIVVHLWGTSRIILLRKNVTSIKLPWYS